MAEHPLACEAWQARLAGWVVAQLDPDEEVPLVEHLATCDRCRAEADGLLAVAAVTLGADPVAPPDGADLDEPPPDLADRILASVARERRARWRTRTAAALTAAAVIVGAAILITRPDDADDGPQRGDEIDFAREARGVDAAAVVAPNGDGTVVFLSAMGLDPADTYTLWLTPPGGGYPDRKAVGTFRADGAGVAVVDLYSALQVDEVGRVWVTNGEGDITLDTES
jgi:hypothetical protein